MRKAAIVGGLCLVVASLLILLNPRLLLPAAAGLLLGLVMRRVWRWRTEDRAARATGVPRRQRSRLSRGVGMSLAVILLTVFVGILVYLPQLGMAPSPRAVVRAPLTFTADYDASRATWTANERFDLTDPGVTEALRLLVRAGRPVPASPTPEDVAALLAAEFGDSWTLALDTGRPTMTRSFEIRTPEGGPWSYDVTLPVANASSQVFDVIPADDAKAVLDTPRHLVLRAAPPISSSEALPGDARETLRIDLPDDPTNVRLDVAPGWARHDVTAWAMTLSLGSLAQVAVGGIVAAITAAFGAAAWSRVNSVWPGRRPSVVAVSGAAVRGAAGTRPVAGGAVGTPDQPGPERPIRILFLAANPLDSGPLRLDEEIRAIDEALRKAEFRDRFEIEQQWAVRVGDLQEALLRYRPDIVHFSGHGTDSSEILLQTETGIAQPVPQDDLSRLFFILRDNIRCVVLSACYSEPQAQAIADHIDCVVGMTTAVGDDAAIEFATGFYRALGYGRDVQTAFDLGANQIGLQGLPDEGAPHLVAKKVAAAEVSFIRDASPSIPGASAT